MSIEFLRTMAEAVRELEAMGLDIDVHPVQGRVHELVLWDSANRNREIDRVAVNSPRTVRLAGQEWRWLEFMACN